MKKELKPLVLNLKREYWVLIQTGLKKAEYRQVTPYWVARLVGKEFSEVHVKLGYPGRSDASKTIRCAWRGFQYEHITHPLFGNEPVRVFAIDVSGILS